jgi:hypothetical protein
MPVTIDLSGRVYSFACFNFVSAQTTFACYMLDKNNVCLMNMGSDFGMKTGSKQRL